MLHVLNNDDNIEIRISQMLRRRTNHTNINENEFKPRITEIIKELKKEVDPNGMKEDIYTMIHNVYFVKPKKIRNGPHIYYASCNNFYINLAPVVNNGEGEGPIELDLSSFHKTKLKSIDIRVSIKYNSGDEFTSDPITVDL